MVALAGAVFIGLAVEVVLGRGIVGFDVALRDALREHGRGPLGLAARLFTDVLSPPFDVTVLLAVAGAVANRRGNWRPLIFAAGLLGVLSVSVLGLKYGIGRPPPDAMAHAKGAFPSGHTASLLVCGGGLVFLLVPPRRRPAAWLALAATTTVLAGCLVYDRFHWFSDVVAAAALGVVVLGVMQRWAPSHPQSQPQLAEVRAASAPVDPAADVGDDVVDTLPGLTLAVPASLALWLTGLSLVLAVGRPYRLADLLTDFWIRAAASAAPGHSAALAQASLATLLGLAAAVCAGLALLALTRSVRWR